jgi:hypothetical protein
MAISPFQIEIYKRLSRPGLRPEPTRLALYRYQMTCRATIERSGNRFPLLRVGHADSLRNRKASTINPHRSPSEESTCHRPVPPARRAKDHSPAIPCWGTSARAKRVPPDTKEHTRPVPFPSPLPRFTSIRRPHRACAKQNPAGSGAEGDPRLRSGRPVWCADQTAQRAGP